MEKSESCEMEGIWFLNIVISYVFWMKTTCKLKSWRCFFFQKSRYRVQLVIDSFFKSPMDSRNFLIENINFYLKYMYAGWEKGCEQRESNRNVNKGKEGCQRKANWSKSVYQSWKRERRASPHKVLSVRVAIQVICQILRPLSFLFYPHSEILVHLFMSLAF